MLDWDVPLFQPSMKNGLPPLMETQMISSDWMDISSVFCDAGTYIYAHTKAYGCNIDMSMEEKP